MCIMIFQITHKCSWRPRFTHMTIIDQLEIRPIQVIQNVTNRFIFLVSNNNMAKELILGVARVMENCQIKGKPKLARSSLQTLLLLHNRIFLSLISIFLKRKLYLILLLVFQLDLKLCLEFMCFDFHHQIPYFFIFKKKFHLFLCWCII